MTGGERMTKEEENEMLMEFASRPITCPKIDTDVGFVVDFRKLILKGDTAEIEVPLQVFETYKFRKIIINGVEYKRRDK